MKTDEIANFVCSTIAAEKAINLDEKRSALHVWNALETENGRDLLLKYCWRTVEKEEEGKYNKEMRNFVQDIMTSAIRDEKERQEVGDKIWKLMAETNNEKIRERYEVLLRHPLKFL